MRFDELAGDSRRVVRGSRLVVRGHDEVTGRIVRMRLLVEWHPAGPLRLARPTVGDLTAVSFGANRVMRGRVVADVPVNVRIHEILRGHDKVAKGVCELR